MKPKLHEVRLEHEWSDGSSRWLKSYEIYLVNEIAGKNNSLKQSVIGDIFWAHVCSPDFKRDPPLEYSKNDLPKAFVQSEFNYNEFIAYLVQRIDAIGCVSPDLMLSKLDEFLLSEQ